MKRSFLKDMLFGFFYSVSLTLAICMLVWLKEELNLNNRIGGLFTIICVMLILLISEKILDFYQKF